MSTGKHTTVRCPVCFSQHVPDPSESSNGVLAATCVHCGHFFKFKIVPPYKSSITITVDGTQYTVGNEYSPSTALNSWLREKRISVGTKHMCFEGGCGTCLVEAKLYEPISMSNKSYAVNSCLLPLYACDGMEIRTVDHIGNLRDGLHPIQKQIADYNGSQCGYCTPGQVMNMFALKEMFGTELTKKQVEDSFDGNICRCTGYRPILKAFKDMVGPTAPVSDIEDLNGKLCRKSGQACQGSCSEPGAALSTRMVFAATQWHRPTTEKEINDILTQATGKKIRFLLGNTSTGVYREFGPDNFDVVIDLTAFREMYSISFDSDIVLGAGLTLSHLADVFTRVGKGSPYFLELANLLTRTANLPVRNRATWTGNICMKHAHNDFPSDIFVLLQVLRAQIWTGFLGNSIPIDTFLSTDITGKIIIAFSFTDLDASEHVKFYKVSQRAQNAHCYVTGGFRAKVDKTTGMVLKAPIVIAYAGLSASFNRATKTEQYLNGKQLTDPTVLQTALTTLQSEIQTDVSPVLSSAAYRTNLALSLFFKFVLHLAGDLAGSAFRSGSSDLFFDRPISSGMQTYDTVPVEYPVTEPMKKLEANAQATGEAEYVDDMITYPGELEAAFVLSTVGNAKIASIDPAAALKIPGVVKVITARDIQGTNNISTPDLIAEEVLADTEVKYCGQPVAIVLAESYGTALGAVFAVKVTYSDVKTPLLTIDDAIKQQSVFPNVCDDKVVGDPDQAIAQSPRKLTGAISTGSQAHFHMETQVSLCVPKEDGLDAFTGTQWIDYTQAAIANVTGLKKNSVRVQVKRLGGAYGARATRNNMVAAACGLAANIVNRPVKFRLTLGDNLRMIGKRYPFLANYEVGFTEAGLLKGVKVTYNTGCGITPNDNCLVYMKTWADNAYLCPNWKLSFVALKTNHGANTWARSPGSLPAIFVMESLMEHVAKSLGKDATEIRLLNTYNQGATDPLTNMVLDDCRLKANISTLQTSADFTKRQQEIAAFNTNNRWKKKGMSLVPLKYGIDWMGMHFACQVSVYNNDGTVAISHGGIEVGQGINTKVAQVCAYEFGIPMTMIQVQASNSFVGANGSPTGGSMTSENCCAAVIQCCTTLNGRIDPVRQKLKDKSWTNVINKCFSEGIDLSVRSWSQPNQTLPFKYYTYGATIAEVEFDVLTGEHTISRVDVLYDCGQSTNPALDVGQVEGAFVMGLGYWLTEECKYDPQTGALVTDSTWEYKPPSSKDIPVDFRVSLLKKSPSSAGVLGAKACGEPPMCMSCSTLFAIKRAIEAARKDVGQDVFFPLSIHQFIMMTSLAFTFITVYKPGRSAAPIKR